MSRGLSPGTQVSLCTLFTLSISPTVLVITAIFLFSKTENTHTFLLDLGAGHLKKALPMKRAWMNLMNGKQRRFGCSVFWQQRRRMGERAGFFSRACTHHQQLCRISLPSNGTAIINPHPTRNTRSWQAAKCFLGCFSCSLVESTKVFLMLLQGNKYVISLPQSPEI